MVRKLSRAGSTKSPRPRLRSLSHPKSRVPGPPRPRRPWLATLQSGPGRRRVGEGGNGSPLGEAAENSSAPANQSSPACEAWGGEGPPERRGLREGDGGMAAPAPGSGGAGGEGSGSAVDTCPPWGAGSSVPASRSPPGLPGAKGNMTNAPAPPSRLLPRWQPPRPSRSSRHFRRAAA